MTKKGIIAIISCAAAFIGLMVIAAFFDLQISAALGNAESVFGQFFSRFGEFPSWTLIPVCFVILYQAVKVDLKNYKYIKLALLAAVFASFYFFFNFIVSSILSGFPNEPKMKWQPLYITVFAVTGTFLSIIATNKVDKDLMQKLVIFAIFSLACIAVSQLVITVMKIIWSRQRFRNLAAGNGHIGETAGFTPWYRPTFGKYDESYFVTDRLGFAKDSDAYKSFPSGHSASAALSFVIIMLPDIFEKLKKYKVWFYVVPSVYTALVMISRIVNRAHYLSDVVVGAGLTTLIIFVLRPLTVIAIDAIKKQIEKRKLPLSIGSGEEHEPEIETEITNDIN